MTVHKSFVPRAWTDEVATGWKKASKLTSADKEKVRGVRAVTSPANDTDEAVRRPLIARAQQKESVAGQRQAKGLKTSSVKARTVRSANEAWERVVVHGHFLLGTTLGWGPLIHL